LKFIPSGADDLFGWGAQAVAADALANGRFAS
jgi:hypothetical protein